MGTQVSKPLPRCALSFFVRVAFQILFRCLPHVSQCFSVSAVIPTTPNQAFTLCSLLRIVQALLLAGI